MEVCVKEKSHTESAQEEIVRHLVNLVFANSTKPRRTDCDQLTRKLILVYPWMWDMGCGYASVAITCGTKGRIVYYVCSREMQFTQLLVAKHTTNCFDHAN